MTAKPTETLEPETREPIQPEFVPPKNPEDADEARVRVDAFVAQGGVLTADLAKKLLMDGNLTSAAEIMERLNAKRVAQQGIEHSPQDVLDGPVAADTVAAPSSETPAGQQPQQPDPVASPAPEMPEKTPEEPIAASEASDKGHISVGDRLRNMADQIDASGNEKPEQDKPGQQPRAGGITLPSLGALVGTMESRQRKQCAKSLRAAANSADAIDRLSASGEMNQFNAAIVSGLTKSFGSNMHRATRSNGSSKWMRDAGISPDEIEETRRAGRQWVQSLQDRNPTMKKALEPMINAFEGLTRWIKSLLNGATKGRSRATSSGPATSAAPDMSP